MMHFEQDRAPDNQQPFAFTQIFIGREKQLAEFERILQEWKRIMANNRPDDTFSTDIPSPSNKLQGLIVLLYGRGGFGKSTILRHYYEIAARENEHQGKITLCRPIDWADAIEGKRAIYNPSQGQSIDASAYFKDLCAQLASHLGKWPKDFRTYQQAASEVEKAKKEASKVLEEMKREKDDMGSALRSATVEIVASVVSTFPGGKIAENEKVKKGADAVLKLTGEQAGHLYQRLHNRLGERLGDYLDPARRLGLALGSDLHAFARNYPLLLFFDTYEEIDEGDALLRLVMGAAGLRVGWIIAGRDNLWSGPGQRARSIALEYGYRDIVPFDRGLSVNFNSEDIGAFTPDNIREYFEQLCKFFPCNPPLPILTPEDIASLWDVTRGIPLAVNIAAALYSETADIEKIIAEVEGKKEIIEQMVRRYLLHTRIHESERARLYALAMLNRTDQPRILAVALELTSEEARTPNRYKEALSHLHRRYSFIFSEKGEPSLHQEVRYFLRLYLLEQREQPDVLALNERLKEAHETVLNELEKQRDYSSLKERLQDEEWAAIYLDLTEQQFWLDPVEGLRSIVSLMIAAAIYQRDRNEEAEQIGAFFAASLPSRYKNWWSWASASLVYRHSRNPSPEERQGLEELNRLLTQKQFKLPTRLNAPEELEAALCWRLGEAYQYQDDQKAVAWYEKALTRLGQEDELKEATAETYLSLSNKLYNEMTYDECIRLLTRAIELRPDYATAYYNRGLAYADQQQYPQAISDYDTAIRLKPDDASAYYNRGAAYYKQQQYELAIVDYTQAITLDSNNVDAYYMRAEVHFVLQQYEQAIDDYSHALGLNPNYDVYLNRGYSYLYFNKVEQARADFMKGAAVNPDDVNMAWMAVFASLSKERPGSEVAEHLEKIAAVNPQANEA